MVSEQDIHNVADVIGLVMSLPLLTTLVGILRFAFTIKNELKNTGDTLKTTSSAIHEILKDHEERLRDSEGKVTILWDGHERRSSERRSNS